MISKIILITIIILAVAIVALGAGTFWYFNAPKAGQEPQINTETLDENTATSELSLLTVISNNVQIKAKADTELNEVLEPSIQVAEGTQVKTSMTGRAIVESKNETTTVIDKNSEFTIITSAENQNKIFLGLGSLWAKVQKVFGKGEYYQIETANAVATVRGTSFGVSYINNLTVIMVTGGEVSLISIDPTTKNQIGNEVMVKAGEKGSIATGNPPVHQELSAADKRSEWYLYNQEKITIPVSTVPSKSQNFEPAPVQSQTSNVIQSASDVPPSSSKR